MTDEEFKKRWKQLRNKQRKFCLLYLENGMNAKAAAIEAGYTGCYIKSPIYRIMRKVNDCIDYLIAKNNIIQSIVKPRVDFRSILKTL